MHRRSLLTIVTSVAVVGSGCISEADFDSPDGTNPTPTGVPSTDEREPSSDDNRTDGEPTRTPPPTGDADLDDLVVKNTTNAAVTATVTITPESTDAEAVEQTITVEAGSGKSFPTVRELRSPAHVRVTIEPSSWEYDWEAHSDSLVVSIREDSVEFTGYVA